MTLDDDLRQAVLDLVAVDVPHRIAVTAAEALQAVDPHEWTSHLLVIVGSFDDEDHYLWCQDETCGPFAAQLERIARPYWAIPIGEYVAAVADRLADEATAWLEERSPGQ